MANLTSPHLRRARLLLPILLMTAACGQEERMQDPTAGQAGSAARSALLAPPPPPGGYRVRAGPTSPPGPGQGPPIASFCSGGCPADSSVVDFELFTDPSVYHQLTTQYASLGVVFDSTVVAVVPGYNYDNYPPRSGLAVASADFTVSGSGSGILYFSLGAEAIRVRGYVTSFSPLTLRCFDAGGSPLAETVFPGGNLAVFHGGPANQPVEISAPGIRSCQFVGPDNQYSVDDLTVVWGEEPELGCSNPIRGEMGICEIVGPLDSILGWEFHGRLSHIAIDFQVGDSVHIYSSSPTRTWGGRGVLSGIVSAIVMISGTTDTLYADFTVADRDDSEWSWGEGDWDNLELWTSEPACGFSALILPGEPRLAVNRRIGACDNLSIEPSIVHVPDSAFTMDSVPTGPNQGMWFVTGTQFRITRVIEINPYIQSSGPANTLVPSDRNACWGPLGLPPGSSPVLVNFYTFNTICKTFSLDAFFTAIMAHEGFGTKNPSTDPAVANGHEARRRIAARFPENDPKRGIENVVNVSRDFLQLVVRGIVFTIDQRLGAFAADSTGFIRDNYLVNGQCGRAWIFHTTPPIGYRETVMVRTIGGQSLCI